MKTQLLGTIFLLTLFFLVVFSTSSCAVLGNAGKDGVTKKESVTPKEQLWQAVRKSNWLVTLSILGIAAGVFALMNGSVKLGTASIVSASVSLFMALAVARFAVWMAVFGLIGSVAAVLFSILVRRKALMEIIRGTQEIKNYGVKQVNLNRDGLNRLLGDTQSRTTKRIVGKMKNELKLKGEI